MLDLSKLGPKQFKFVMGTKKKSLFEGAFRCGKTYAGAYRLILLAYNFPRNRILVSRKTYRRLFDTTFNTFWDCVPNELVAFQRKSEAKVFLYDKEGSVSEIMWRSLEREEDYGEIKNLDLGAIWLDQAEEFPEEIYKMLLSRLTLQNIPYRPIFLTANPPVNEIHWLAKIFPYESTEADSGKWLFEGKDYEIIIGETLDNVKHLPEGYIEGLQTDYSDDWAEVYVRGRRGHVKTGAPVLTEFNSAIHKIPQVWTQWKGEVKGNVLYIRSWDFGRVRPGITWARVVYPYENSHRPFVQFLCEFLGDNITTPALCKVVKETSSRNFSFVNEWIDIGDPRSAFKANEATGTRIVDLLNAENIKLVRLELSDPSGRADLINSWLSQNVLGVPRFQVMAGNPILLGGLGGGYHRRKPQFGKPVDDSPVKDGFYEHIIDSAGFIVQYLEGGSYISRKKNLKMSKRLVESYGRNNLRNSRPKESDAWTKLK